MHAVGICVLCGCMGGLSYAACQSPCENRTSCFPAVLRIVSPQNDLATATGCGGLDEPCKTVPCAQLGVGAPTDGGICVVVVTFDDGGTTNISFDWGRVHASDCCGPSYDSPGGTVIVHD